MVDKYVKCKNCKVIFNTKDLRKGDIPMLNACPLCFATGSLVEIPEYTRHLAISGENIHEILEKIDGLLGVKVSTRNKEGVQVRMINLVEQDEETAFARRAAIAFAKDSSMVTFGDLEPGSFLAMRWGLDDDCVVVLKLSDSFEPRNYMNIIKKRV